MRVMPWIPIAVIDSVQNSDDAVTPLAQRLLHSHAEWRLADLARVGGADRCHYIGKFYPTFQRVNNARATIAGIQAVFESTQSKVGDCCSGHDALIPDVMNRQHRAHLGESRYRPVHRLQQKG